MSEVDGGTTRLVSFLGTGRYEVVRYGGVDPAGEERERETRYVTRFLAELHEADEVVVLGTREAFEVHREGLRAELEDAGHGAVSFSEVPFGSTADELWRLFFSLHEALRPAPGVGRILLDITHGFRAQPFFAAAVLAFLRCQEVEGDSGEPTLEEIRVVYGAIDREQGTGNIWDLSTFVDVLDWAFSIRVFLASGTATGVAGPTERLGRSLRREWARTGRSGDPPEILDLGRALSEFGRDLTTLRTGSLFLGREPSEGGSVTRLREVIERTRGTLPAELAPLDLVLDRLLRWVEPLDTTSLTDESGRRAVVELARIQLAQARYAEAAATIREGWVTLHASPCASNPGRPSFCSAEREEAEGRAFRSARDGKKVKAALECRNDVLHAGFRANAAGADKIVQGLEARLETLEQALPGREERVFANITNHPCEEWQEPQLRAARQLAGAVQDLPFPRVPPDATTEEVRELARQVVKNLPEHTTHALVQGEATLVGALVPLLRDHGVRCYAATSERSVRKNEDGSRTSVFEFVGLREYP